MKRSVFRDYIETVLICFVLVIFLRTFVFQQSEIPSGSMEDTILVGDYILVNRFLYAPTTFDWESRILPIRPIRRGDIVVFKHPPAPEQDYIKRVVGLPGETVGVVQGRLLIDGRPLHEPYVNEQYLPSSTFGPVVVPTDHVFLMGDHRNRSSDSRDWGPARADLLKGHAFMILFSTRAEPDPDDVPGRITVRSTLRKFYNIVFRARWDRFFLVIR